MPVPATKGVLRTKLSDMAIGDYIVWAYASNLGYVFGDPSGLPELPLSGAVNGSVAHYWYGIKVRKGLIFADRMVSHTVTFDAFNSTKQVQGRPLTISGTPGIERFITGGVQPIAPRSLVPKMTSNTAPSGKVTASSAYSTTYEGWKAFTGTNAGPEDGWASASGATTGSVEYEFVTPTVVDTYVVASRNYMGNDSTLAAPKDWVIEGTQDGVTYDTLHVVNNEVNWGVAESRMFSFTNSTPYKKIRISVTANNNWTFVSIGMLRFMNSNDRPMEASNFDYGFGVHPTNNEWDRYIVNATLNDKITPGDDNVWHWSTGTTLCQDTVVNGVMVSNTAATSGHRTYRGGKFAAAFNGVLSNASAATIGYRPVFEYREV